MDTVERHIQDAAGALSPLAFYMPLDLSKSEEEEDPASRDAQGYATDESEDQQGERLKQDDLDWSYYNTNGIWTDNHAGQKKGTPVVAVASPIAPAEFHPGVGWFVKGRFLDTERGNYWLETGRALRRAGSFRKLALSVEGFYRSQRMPGTPLAASIVNVAVTHNPVNTSKRCTLDLLGKALSTVDAAPAVKEDLEGGTRKSSATLLRRLVNRLANHLMATRRMSRPLALRTALGFVKRKYAC
ncbi:MAG: hypothetical protein HY816_20035 [Candidatus Wallbacteria bacterium]|nr:hypothetical protein [Candidatus Wallbacteria bacterium]